MSLSLARNAILLKELVKTDFKLRYQDSALGFVWSLLNPLFTFLVMYFVFDQFFGMGRMAGVEHFPIQLLLGLILWQFFAEATTLSMLSIVSHGDILRKVNFPKHIVVVAGTISSLINLGLSTIVLMIFAIVNQVQFTWRVLLLPLSVLEMYIFALGLGFCLATLYVKFRDIAHIWGVLMQAWMYATPILYQLILVTNFSLTASKVMMLLPPAQIIQDARYNFISPHIQYVMDAKTGTVPIPSLPTVFNFFSSPLMISIPFATVAVIFIVSIIYFSKSAKHFAEEI
jgi:ABC-2 type transport system permease protein